MRCPLIPVAAVFGAGIAAGSYSGLSSAFFTACLLCFFAAACLLFFSGMKLSAFLLALTCFFCAGAACFGRYDEESRRDMLALGEIEPGAMVLIRGRISGSPSFSSFTVSMEDISREGTRESSRGKALVINHTGNTGYDFGDSVRVRGLAGRRPGAQREAGSGEGEVLVLNVYSDSWIENTGPGNMPPLTRGIRLVRDRIESNIDSTMNEPESLFLKSVFLGKRHGLPRDIRETLARVGLGHFLAVSGLHVGLLLLFVTASAGLAGVPLKKKCLLGIACAAVFCLLTGARVPTVRAAVMASVFLLGTVLDREVNGWNALAASALFILALNPSELFKPGFQMSFAAVAGIFYIGPRLGPGGEAGDGARRGRRQYIRVMCAAQAAALPLVAFHYGMLPLASPLSNLVLMPFMSVIVGLGLAGGLAGLVSVFPAAVLNAANSAVIRFVIDVSRMLDRVPAVEGIRIPGAALVLYYVFLAVSLEFFAARERKREDRISF